MIYKSSKMERCCFSSGKTSCLHIILIKRKLWQKLSILVVISELLHTYIMKRKFFHITFFWWEISNGKLCMDQNLMNNRLVRLIFFTQYHGFVYMRGWKCDVRLTHNHTLRSYHYITVLVFFSHRWSFQIK